MGAQLTTTENKNLTTWCVTYSSVFVLYEKTPIITTCLYIIEYNIKNSTLILIVYMTTYFSITHYLNITEVPSLLIVNTYVPF
jgi:hypothetical protein